MEFEELQNLIQEAVSAAVASIVADIQTELTTIKKQLNPEAQSEAETEELRKQFRRDAINLGVAEPKTPEEKKQWREKHGTEFEGKLLDPRNI